MFNPKITKGEWNLHYISALLRHVEKQAIKEDLIDMLVDIGQIKCEVDAWGIPIEPKISPCNESWGGYDDAKAIAAVPELLEVYRAIKEFSDYHACDRDFNFTYGESFNPVLAAIKKLEERQ